MSDVAVKDETWLDRTLTENQLRVRDAAALIPVKTAGAVPENFAQLVDYAHWMSRAQIAIPAHLVGNVGACLAVIEISKKFNYPAYMVARQSYVVNGVLSFMGQFIMAVINDFCPLRERLKFRYEGEGPDLRVFVTGHFKSETDPLIYESPRFADVPVKKSPLWASDPRQQFKYFGARRWQSAYWPEGLFGIFAVDDVLDSQIIDAQAEQPADGLASRLAAAQQTGEGFQDGHAHRELAQVAPNARGAVIEGKAESDAGRPGDGAPAAVAERPVAEQPSEKDPPRTTSLERGKRTTKAAAKKVADRAEKASAAKAKTDLPPAPIAIGQCKTAEGYVAYCRAWIDASLAYQAAQDRFESEREDRIRLQVPVKESISLQNRIDAKFGT